MPPTKRTRESSARNRDKPSKTKDLPSARDDDIKYRIDPSIPPLSPHFTLRCFPIFSLLIPLSNNLLFFPFVRLLRLLITMTIALFRVNLHFV